MNDEGFVLDKPSQIEMFGLLQARGRLHLEIKGIRFRQSTLAALQRAGITKARTRAKALEDLNRHIESLGGPADTRLQREKEE